MAKNIIKEITIVLLLTLAIILILGVLLYEYVPTNKIIPEQVSYTTPETVREELSAANSIDEEQMVMTYEVTASDLKNYQKVNDYKAGKKNPFAASSTTTGNVNNAGGSQTTGNTTANTTGENTNGNGSGTTNSNNEGYFQNKGTK